jgi:hypothetical protein
MLTIEELFEKLVPRSGSCSTLEGEFVRAFCKLRYRYFNDGDIPDEGYGIETCGPCAIFLESEGEACKYDPLWYSAKALTQDVLGNEVSYAFGHYEEALENLENVLCTVLTPLVEAGDLTPFEGDMYDKKYKIAAQEQWEDEEDEEDYWG